MRYADKLPLYTSNLASLEHWIPNCVDDPDDLHGIFEIQFEDEEITKILTLQTYTVTFTDNLLIVTFQKYDYTTEKTHTHKFISDEQLKEVFNHKQNILLNIGNRMGNIVKIYEFNNCELNCLTDDVFDYRLSMDINITECLIFKYDFKNIITPKNTPENTK